MKRFIFYLIILVFAVWLGIKIAADPGYALFAYQNWTVEMPLWFATLATIILFLILHNIILLIRGTGALAKRMKIWSAGRKARKSQVRTNRGLLELAEGKWQSAEKLLMSKVKYNSAPLINYLGAARAAQEQGAYERRDDYLRMAHERTPGSEIAVGLTQAELQYSHQQLEQSLATLRHLQNMVPKHAYVLKLLKHLYVELGDWECLLELIPELRKRKVLSSEELQALEQQAYKALLTTAVKSRQPNELQHVWDRLSRSLRRDKAIVKLYVEGLVQQHSHNDAELVLRDHLKHQWDGELVALYGQIETEYPEKQLDVAEGWLKSHGNSPALLLSLGYLCMRNKLWGKAKDYLQTSIDLEPTAEAYQQFGALLEHLEEPETALQQYRQGLAVALQ